VTEIELIKNTGADRYELHLDGHQVSLASYYERDNVVVLPHTETDPAYGGKGYAGQLVKFALDDIRAQERKVDPACPYVADYIAKHPEYADLLE
jgi:predicted GNAT family acetyltransferase